MVTFIWANIGTGNGLLPDATKPLPEPWLPQTTPVEIPWHFPDIVTIFPDLIHQYFNQTQAQQGILQIFLI